MAPMTPPSKLDTRFLREEYRNYILGDARLFQEAVFTYTQIYGIVENVQAVVLDKLMKVEYVERWLTSFPYTTMYEHFHEMRRINVDAGIDPPFYYFDQFRDFLHEFRLIFKLNISACPCTEYYSDRRFMQVLAKKLLNSEPVRVDSLMSIAYETFPPSLHVAKSCETFHHDSFFANITGTGDILRKIIGEFFQLDPLGQFVVITQTGLDNFALRCDLCCPTMLSAVYYLDLSRVFRFRGRITKFKDNCVVVTIGLNSIFSDYKIICSCDDIVDIGQSVQVYCSFINHDKYMFKGRLLLNFMDDSAFELLPLPVRPPAPVRDGHVSPPVIESEEEKSPDDDDIDEPVANNRRNRDDVIVLAAKRGGKGFGRGASNTRAGVKNRSASSSNAKSKSNSGGLLWNWKSRPSSNRHSSTYYYHHNHYYDADERYIYSRFNRNRYRNDRRHEGGPQPTENQAAIMENERTRRLKGKFGRILKVLMKTQQNDTKYANNFENKGFDAIPIVSRIPVFTDSRFSDINIYVDGMAKEAEIIQQIVMDTWNTSEAGSKYRIFEDVRNWTDAQQHCSSFGAYLAIVDSDAKNEFVKDLLRETPPSFEYSWIGLRTVLNKNMTGREECTMIDRVGNWTIADCSQKNSFVCQVIRIGGALDIQSDSNSTLIEK
ncbi:unnamed protein product [Caenorhabditis bovis]|uniref:C-type lectin domain-containing protein n=1 Tax=Caenorhabditis bovis TaxID=2654633 RepID=A0A8S1EJ79_9PELO|nr:unnamed protein product [Caenorhabditis bovis]